MQFLRSQNLGLNKEKKDIKREKYIIKGPRPFPGPALYWHPYPWKKPLFSLDMALNTHEKGFTIPKTIPDSKNLKIWNLLCLQGSNLAPKMDHCCPPWRPARRWSSVIRWDITVIMLFCTRFDVPRQIKHENLQLTITRGHNNFSNVFIFLGVREKWRVGEKWR